MVIDFHTHTFPPVIAQKALAKLSAASSSRPFTDGTPDGLSASMKKSGVDVSVVLPVATNPLKVSHMNDSFSPGLTENGLLSFACMHPETKEAEKEIDRIASLGFLGFKIHPVYQGVDIDDLRFLKILSRAGERGLVVVMHAGDDIGFPGVVRCSPEGIRRALLQVGNVPLVLAHMGGWKNWDRVACQLSDTDVFLDTSFSLGEIPALEGCYSPEEKRLLGEEEFVRLVRIFGSERILFGTDSPWTGQKESLEAFCKLPLTAKEKSDILEGNAKKLLKI